MQGRSLNGKTICFKPLKREDGFALKLQTENTSTDTTNILSKYSGTPVSYHAVT